MSPDLQQTVRKLQRDLLILKVALALGLIAACSVGAIEAQVGAERKLDTSSILLRSSSGVLVAELRVENGAEHDLTLRDAKGIVRFSLSGLTGINIPSYTEMKIHDPQGRERVALNADQNYAGIGVSAATNVTRIDVDGAPRSQTRISLGVDKEKGSLKFFDPQSRGILTLPND